ncbi:MAG: Flp family type IVb pilin [Proteobacteria bacterium]|nr:Flp family type IVb pilin [Pseudomonadota bacterium]
MNPSCVATPIAKSTTVHRWPRLRDNRSGVTAIEYGLIAGAIALAIIAAAFAIGGDLKSLFETASTALKGS